MPNSIEKAIRDFNFSDYGLDLLDELKYDEGAQDWIKDLASEIEMSVLLSYEDQAISAELVCHAYNDIILPLIDDLIAKGHEVIIIRGMKIGNAE